MRRGLYSGRRWTCRDIFERLGVPEAESARIRIETMDPAFALRIS